MVKQLHITLSLLIVLDLCQLHYQNLLITRLVVGLKNDRLIYNCKECKEEWKRPINVLIENFPSTYQFCNGFVMLLRKGAYPYEYMDSWEKFDETVLPPKKAFYSNLNLENINDL